ncbi:L,D-transpeptidase family protein [Bdellovibrio sp. HCB2-146]|uniref:L,D-transpeptidase family protein n=1 Tax=Bdellovibrio sp. HCB2-146 TaxID=3394362 RepID=UPI0039BC8107
MKWQVLVRKSVLLGISASLLLPMASYAAGEDMIRNYVARQTTVPLIKPSWGNFIIHTEPLNKLYALRGYAAIWVDANGVPNANLQALRAVLARANRHGLVPSDYWDSEMDSLLEKVTRNSQNWITFELAASESLIRYVTHLSTGRFDPELVDTDIKYKKREFTEFNELASIIAAGGDLAGLDRLAPTHSRYRDLMQILAQLREMKQAGGWEQLTLTGKPLKRGANDPLIAQSRQRLIQLGYQVNAAGGNIYDAELEAVVREYQANSGLSVDGVIGKDFTRSMNYSVAQRISQVEVNMEKLRWLPRTIETRHIFVNLATTEFRLFDESGMRFHFNTVNGQSFRRTPSMRDSITFVELNPTWTVPHSIAIRDKIPQIKKDVGYLEKHNMVLLDASTDEVVNPYSVDWSSINARNFPYYIRQNPGPDNALGVVKFPLQNPWAIYMHDTNEKNLFAESNRHRSSGCVRLEQPLELAAYLLQDQPQWSLPSIQAFVPMAEGQQATELQKRVFLKKAMPVYFTFLTVEKSENGQIRFVDDVYGQDLRLARALANKRNGNEPF